MATNVTDYSARSTDESAKDPYKFKIITLKEILRRRNLSTFGSKKDLIGRLLENDPTDQWMIEATEVQGGSSNYNTETTMEEDGETGNLAAGGPSANSSTHGLNERELGLVYRERDLLARELALARRENEMLRQNPRPQEREQSSTRQANINTIRELLSEFDGNNADFRRWKEQFQLVCTTYQLDDDAARLLMSTKLKGRALQWF